MSETIDAPPAGIPADAIDVTGDGGLYKRMLKEGVLDAGIPGEGDEVQVHYTGTLMDGSKFDSSRDRPGNFNFRLGKGAVIKGWDEGVKTMLKGEVAELFCRSDYAYGESGSPPKIPGGATLKFEVELLSWAAPKKERWELSGEEKLVEAMRLKSDGTDAFKNAKYEEAQLLYAEAGSWVDNDSDFDGDEQKLEASALFVSCFLNDAQCALKQNDWSVAAARCTKVLDKDGSNVKALFRRGTARIKLAEFAEARADLREASRLDPKSKDIREAFASVKVVEAEAKARDKAMFSKMVKGAGGVNKSQVETTGDTIDVAGNEAAAALEGGDEPAALEAEAPASEAPASEAPASEAPASEAPASEAPASA